MRHILLLLLIASASLLNTRIFSQATGDIPQSKIFPEPADWNGSDQLFIQCTGCAEIRYSVNGEQKKYAGPITLPPTGGELRFYGVSVTEAREPEKVFSYRAGGEAPWKTGVLNVSPLIFLTMGGMQSTLPTAWGAGLSYDQGPDNFLRLNNRNWLIPGLRIETGLLLYKKADKQEAVVPLNAGPIWAWSPFSSHSGYFIFSPTFGPALIAASTTGFSKTAFTSNLQVSTGYQYNWDIISFLFTVRYGWFFDRDISLHGLGFSVSVGYQIF